MSCVVATVATILPMSETAIFEVRCDGYDMSFRCSLSRS